MINGIDIVTTYVRDQDEALAWYRDVLGFEVTTDTSFEGGRRWVTVTPAGGAVALVLALPDWLADGPDRQRASGLIGLGPQVVFTASDLDATYTELVKRGVDVLEPPTEQPWGSRQAIFRDLYGGLVVVVEPPGGTGN